VFVARSVSMPFSFLHLDGQTRPLMLDEIAFDVAADKLYLSDRLNNGGRQNYPAYLKQAAELQDEVWFAEQLRSNNCFNATFQRRNPKGGFTTVHMPFNAAETLAEGEFNRFYIRGLCRRALETGIAQLIIYRAKPVEKPRAESEQRVGAVLEPSELLQDLRTNIAVETCLGMPPGPNSGLCVKFAALTNVA
jgi:hypothetical protein